MKDEVYILGGGIIGVCAAYYLTAAGRKVTIIDKGDFSDGASYGNAGMIVPSHFVPMATPGVISQGLKWLLDSKSPFHVKPRFDAELISWLWKFYRSANKNQVKRSMPVLLELNTLSKELYKEMAIQEDFDFGFEQKGLLMLYKSQKQEREEIEMAEQANRQGLAAEILDLQGLAKLEPDMHLDVRGGLYFPGDAHLYPNKLMIHMIATLKGCGVQFIANEEVIDMRVAGNRVEALISKSGRSIDVGELLVTAGSWTGSILKKAGVKIHLQDGKGYSLTIEKPTLRPRIPTILSEAKVAITPMGNDLRVGGTLELSGLSPNISQSRVQGIIESVPQYYKNMPMNLIERTPVWQGYRPCTPDGMPYIGKSSYITNMTIGTGHGMMGLSLGAATGKILSQLVNNEQTMIAIDPFMIERF